MKIKKILFVLLIIAIGLAVTTILFLEILSRSYKCEAPPRQVLFSCREENRPGELKEKEWLLDNLKDKRLRGEKISEQEYRQAADVFIAEAEPSKLGNYFNGIACRDYGYGYVRNDLPEGVKHFVKRHELEHLLQVDGKRNAEFSANFATAKEYPLGLIKTILFSIKYRAEYFGSRLCYILNLWQTFKVYLLPFLAR